MEKGDHQQQGLEQRLAEAEATLEAIRDGLVDAVVVRGGARGQQVYALESEDLPYRQFLESMGEGAVSLDADGRFLFCNRFLSELIGRSREDLLGTPFETLVVASSSPAYRAALASDRPQRVGVDLHLPDGRELPVQLALTPVGSEAARRVIMVVTDLSERERLRELSAAREVAEAESLAKDQFLAAVGHDLRTPLNVVVGWTALLLERSESFDEQTLKALVTIDRNARLQAKLLDDLLDISRIAAGKLEIERSELDLAELVRSLGGALSLSAQKKGIEIDVTAPGAIFVLGDGVRLGQVLNNLIDNAIKFTPQGGRVRVQVARTDGCARIEIQDNGQGIDPEQLPRLFAAFRQANPLSRRKGGLGLGLAISKRLVELHDGRVSAHSEGAGHGACFVVELPVLALARPYRERRATPSAGIRTLHGLRVLLVDDEEDIGEFTAQVLRSLGAEVVGVPGAAAALARYENEAFDLVVSDLRMPGTDGFEFARELRQRYGSQQPLLAVSGLSGVEDVERALGAGFSAHLPKPVEPDGLLRVITQVMAGHERGPEQGLASTPA